MNENSLDDEFAIAKNIRELKPDYTNSMDLRGDPLEVCICGCFIWNLKVSWDEGELATYFEEMECASCGSMATAPMPGVNTQLY